MKIGFFTDSYNPRTVSGVEVSIETFRKGLEALGHEVFIYAPRVADYKDTNPRVFRFGSLKIIKKPEMYLALPLIFKNHLEEITKIVAPKLDIIHSHSIFTMGLFGRFIADYQKIPLIYTHHTHYPEYAKIYLKEKLLLPRMVKSWITWYANRSDGVITPSYKIKTLLRDYGVKRPIIVLPTGINLKIFKQSSRINQILRRKLNIGPETKILLFVGRIGKEKNIAFLFDVLREILKRRQDVLLLLVGGGPDLERLEALAKNLQIDKFVKFTDWIPYQEIPAYYRVADIFVFPSLTETQGVVVLEAIAASLPVVAFKDDAFRGVVINNKNGFLIQEHSVKFFAEKIIKFLEFPLLRKKFAISSRQIARGFSEEAQAQKLFKIYQDFI